jgi:hypothetical protein
MQRVGPWIVRGMAVYLALGFAFIMGVMARLDEPQPSMLRAFVPALVFGALTQAGLFWAPSAKGRRRSYAALLMVPSAVFLSMAAVEELSFMFGGHMHAPSVAFAYLGGVAVYLWQFFAVLRREPRQVNARPAA